MPNKPVIHRPAVRRAPILLVHYFHNLDPLLLVRYFLKQKKKKARATSAINSSKNSARYF